MNKSNIYQKDIRSWIEGTWGTEIMIPIYGILNKEGMDIFIQSYVISSENTDSQMKTDEYDIHTSLLPGCTQYGAWEDSEVLYSRFNNEVGAEPFVIKRDYHGFVDDEYEIIEEFRLLFNLYYKRQTKEYIDLKEDVIVVKISDNNTVSVHKKYLKSYLAIKNASMIVHVDSRCIFEAYDNTIEDDSLKYQSEDGNSLYTLSIGKYNNLSSKENYSILFGKKIINGCALQNCGIWPYNEEKVYEEFSIGIDEDGNEISFTCNPDKLANYFGANLEAPNYLTPVFFNAEVLNKYYAKPEKYEVGDCIIRCGNLWSLYIDNQKKDFISAYLGDLGRDLPSKKEQLYWKSFNVVTGGQISNTKFKRDFMAQFTNPESIDFIFKNKYLSVNKMYNDKMGWGLFLPLSKEDSYNFEGIRIPVTNSIVEMDMLTLSLVKILLDSLNEKRIVAQLSGSYEKLTGSISKLEVWIKENGLENYQNHIKFLRNLQELRSSGTGHRKGKNYAKISKIFDVSQGNYTDAFANILEQAVAFLNYMEDCLDVLCTS